LSGRTTAASAMRSQKVSFSISLGAAPLHNSRLGYKTAQGCGKNHSSSAANEHIHACFPLSS
jgi:hypothetical protein